MYYCLHKQVRAAFDTYILTSMIELCYFKTATAN
jgi:hypothetical protein